MPINRTQLPSIVYWRGERQPQRFYVAFCLLMSSIQDAILGLKERREKNLNWAATCSYYSLVHAGRLITFLSLGDFPTSHAKLRGLFSPTRTSARPTHRETYGFPFDWLRGFNRNAGAEAQMPQAEALAPSWFELRDAIRRYVIDSEIRHAAQRFDQFGRIFCAAGPLRSDSNYESLLIAHEYEHVPMSSAFENLSGSMATAAESQVPFAIDVFNGFLQTDIDITPDRSAYFSFLQAYLYHRVVKAITSKLSAFPEEQAKLNAIVSTIYAPETGANYRNLEDLVSIEIFGGKAALMRRFQARIDEFRRTLESPVP